MHPPCSPGDSPAPAVFVDGVIAGARRAGVRVQAAEKTAPLRSAHPRVAVSGWARSVVSCGLQPPLSVVYIGLADALSSVIEAGHALAGELPESRRSQGPGRLYPSLAPRSAEPALTAARTGRSIGRAFRHPAQTERMTTRFPSELQTILMSEDSGVDAREALLASCRRRSVAGVCCFRFSFHESSHRGAEVLWVEDLSGELEGLDVSELTRTGFETTPTWLLRWIVRRKRPFQLHRFARLIPFSAATILRATAPSGRRPLADILVVPYRHNSASYGALIGLFSPAPPTVAEELATLAAACLARQSWDSQPHSRPELSKRQLECLQWVVAGKTVSETAAITGMTYRNVRYHLDRAKEQCGLASLQQLAAVAAVEYGLSPLGPGERAESGQPFRGS